MGAGEPLGLGVRAVKRGPHVGRWAGRLEAGLPPWLFHNPITTLVLIAAHAPPAPHAPPVPWRVGCESVVCGGEKRATVRRTRRAET